GALIRGTAVLPANTQRSCRVLGDGRRSSRGTAGCLVHHVGGGPGRGSGAVSWASIPLSRVAARDRRGAPVGRAMKGPEVRSLTMPTDPSQPPQTLHFTLT